MQVGVGSKFPSLKLRAHCAISLPRHLTRTVSRVLPTKFGWRKATKRFSATSKSSHAVRASGGGSAWTAGHQKLSIMRFRIAALSFHNLHTAEERMSKATRIVALTVLLSGTALTAGCGSIAPVLDTCSDLTGARIRTTPPPDAQRLRGLITIDPNLRELSDYWFQERNGDITLCRATRRQSCLGEWWTFRRTGKDAQVVGHGGPSCILLTHS